MEPPDCAKRGRAELVLLLAFLWCWEGVAGCPFRSGLWGQARPSSTPHSARPSPFTLATSTEGFQATVNQLCVFKGVLELYVALRPIPSLPTWLFSTLALCLAQCHNTGVPQLKSSLQPSPHGVYGDLLGSRAGINARLMEAGINAKLLQAGTGP